MRFGIALFPTVDSPELTSLARLIEGLGFESMWLSDHTHIPLSGSSTHPLGGPTPEEYSKGFDPFIALSAVASATSRLRIGTAVCLVTERDPIVTAKQVATLDVLSAGRFIFGVGAGWNREEMMNHGTDPSTRFALLVDRLQAMKVIWSQDEACYRGEFVRFDPMLSWPKPAQKPHPPILMGGSSHPTLKRAALHADGWMPPFWAVSDRIAEHADTLARETRAVGRPTLPITILGATGEDPRHDELPSHELINSLEQLGVHRWIFRLPSSPATESFSRLTTWATFLESVR